MTKCTEKRRKARTSRVNPNIGFAPKVDTIFVRGVLMLYIKNFSKEYSKGKKAVDNISLTVSSGEIFGFIGHNGAGKTTTIKSIVGILEFNEGDILIDNKSIKKNPIECKKLMAYIPDNPDLYEALTGIQYLSFIADIYKVSKEQREKLIKYYGDKFELTKYLGDLI